MAMEWLTRGIGVKNNTSEMRSRLYRIVTWITNYYNHQDFEEFQGFVGLSKDIYARVKSPDIQRI
jgi:5-bromo-4-chloroindolyl phosphate hydrolysis protein